MILAVAEHSQICFELLLTLHSLGLLAVVHVNEDVELADRDLDGVRNALQELIQVLSVRDALLIFKCNAVGVIGFFYCGSVILPDLHVRSGSVGLRDLDEATACELVEVVLEEVFGLVVRDLNFFVASFGCDFVLLLVCFMNLLLRELYPSWEVESSQRYRDLCALHFVDLIINQIV